MGNLKLFLVGLAIPVALLSSCSREDDSADSERATLYLGPVLKDLAALNSATRQFFTDLPECSEAAPSYVMLVLSNEGTEVVGTEEAPFKVDLSTDDWFTKEVPELELEPGTYSLDYFAVYTSPGKLLWLSPKGGTMAALSDDPLPLSIELSPGAREFVDVPVICFDGRIMHEYGYLFPEMEDVETVVQGGDLVVFNDLNLIDNTSMKDGDNVRLVKNLVNFPTTASRKDASAFMFHFGYMSLCTLADCNITSVMREVVAAEGFTITEYDSAAPLIEIPPEIKVIMIMMPLVRIPQEEIDAYRKFAAEGGRIIFMGDHEDAYPGISIENQFLSDMGAELYNTGGAVDCILDNPVGTRFPALPGKDKRHPIMEGVRELSMACASVIEPGAGDFPLFFDTTGTFVLGGVARIGPTPVTRTKAATVQNKRPAPRENLVNPESLTGK